MFVKALHDPLTSLHDVVAFQAESGFYRMVHTSELSHWVWVSDRLAILDQHRGYLAAID